MLPEVIDYFGGNSEKFDTKIEILVTVTVVISCSLVLLYIHIFLDENLRPKPEPLAFIPYFGWQPVPTKQRKKE